MAQIGNMDQKKITKFINLLTGKVLKWATTVWEKSSELTTSYKCFAELFHRVFDHNPKGVEIGKRLLTFKQGRRRVAEYALEFCMLTAGSG